MQSGYKKLMSRIILVPSSHIAEESLRRIEATVMKEQPDCIAVELDPERFVAMQAGGGRPSIRELGVWGFLVVTLMKAMQDWLGRKVGILPGSEMLKAAELARETGVHLHFIDRPIHATLQGMKAVPWKEKVKLLFLLVRGISIGKKVEIDLKRVPDTTVVDQAIGFLEQELPGFYRVLISERDAYMAHQLMHLSAVHKKIVAVVGAGHRKGLMKHLGRPLK